MEGKIYTFRIQGTLIDVYKNVVGYRASIYGQLPLPFDQDEDEIKQLSLIDLIIIITLKYCATGFKLEVYDKEDNIWLDF